MYNDYRNTKYCPKYDEIYTKKSSLYNLIKTEHKKAIDMHTQVSNNKNKYKKIFMDIYNNKCAYCGVSNALISKEQFEIDHFIYKESVKFKTKADAGTMENLILSCHRCNHNKSSFIVTDDIYDDVYPDNSKINDTFVRDENYYIRVKEPKDGISDILSFYEKLGLGDEIHRIDYLLMNMIGLQKVLYEKQFTELHSELSAIIFELQKKRNDMV